MKTIAGKVVVIAGGSGGIGSEVYKKLLLLDAEVIGISRKENIYLKKFSENNNKEYNWIISDLSSISGWEDSLTIVKEKFGKIDVLVNCVGVLFPGKVENLTYGQIEQVISSNFTSVVIAYKSILPIMTRQGFGNIINVGSLGGIIPMPYESLYCATKFALRGFSLSIQRELSDTGINISLISPGSVFTKMLASESSDPDSTIAFVNYPVKADLVAEKIIHLILHPNPELISTSGIQAAALLLNLFPNFFNLIYPVLNYIGKRNREKLTHLLKHFKENFNEN
ncbi:MAG: SDR family NAD(P)-dependent oxidoreductase [Ignavibacteriaceae bacterium]